MMIPVFQHKTFDELTTQELYDILQLRALVFIVEQQCPYLDPDGKDVKSGHLCGYLNYELVAYARILPPGMSYPDHASIGRVVTHPDQRRTGAGKLLMDQALQLCQNLYPGTPISISAQAYLIDFYSRLGFEGKGDIYLEDDIPHLHMVFNP